MIKKIDHIGIAVNNIEEQVPYYRDILGLEIEAIETVESEGVKVCFVKVGDIHIELLEPISEESPIKKFLEKKGQGIHHIAYLSNDIDADIAKFRQEGVKLLADVPKLGAHNKKIIFAHPKSTFSVLTEICSL